MNISFRESFLLKKIPEMEGAFGFLATYKSLPKGTVIKVLNSESNLKRRNIKRLLRGNFIENSGYPLDYYSVDEHFRGFIMLYFDKALTFEEEIKNAHFTHREKMKAAIDCARQLKQLHKQGFLFNDIALSNQLIDKDGGHLVDFDAVTKGQNETSVETHYDLILGGTKLSSSYNLDRLYQAITNLSLLYGIDLEEIIIKMPNIKSIIGIFKENKDIYYLLESYLSNDNNSPYFDVLEKSLQDENRILVESAKIYRKTNNLV